MNEYKRNRGDKFTDKPEKHSNPHKHLLSGKRRSKLYKKGG